MKKKIVIFGPYKTGTTGLFYKIYNSLPGSPRTLFEPSQYTQHKTDAARGVLAKVILNNDGSVQYDGFLDFDKKIYLVRDPRDWVISGLLFSIPHLPAIYTMPPVYNHIMDLLQQKEQAPASISTVELVQYVFQHGQRLSLDEITTWLHGYFDWILAFEARFNDYQRLKYEDFVDENLEALETYLGFPLLGAAVVSQEHAHVPRTLSYENWRNWFLPGDIDYFRPIFKSYMRQYGYNDDWTLNNPQAINPETGSQYVRRIVTQAQNTERQNMDATQEFTYRPFQKGDEVEINAGFNEIFNLQRPLDEWHWKFQFENDDCWIMLAIDKNDELVAQYASIRQWLQVAGKTYLAGQPVDVYRLRRPTTKGKQVFVYTVRAFFETYCSPEHINFMFGFPGEHALRVGQRDLDYGDEIRIQLWGKPIPAQTRFRMTWNPWKRHKVIEHTAETLNFNAVDELWRGAMPRYKASLVRDSAWLKRRYLTHPTKEYRYLTVESQNGMDAWAVLQINEDKLQWIDLVWNGESASSLNQLETAIIQLGRSLGAGSAEMWLSGDGEAQDILRQRGWNCGDHPQLLYLVGRSWHPDLDSAKIIQDLYLTMGDSDLI